MAEIRDLSTAAPEPVFVRIGNGDDIQEIDLTIVPAAATLHLNQAAQEHGGIGKIPDDDMVAAIAEICRRANPAVTADWLMTTCTRPQITALTQIVVQQAFRMWGGAPKGDAGKNR